MYPSQIIYSSIHCIGYLLYKYILFPSKRKTLRYKKKMIKSLSEEIMSVKWNNKTLNLVLKVSDVANFKINFM